MTSVALLRQFGSNVKRFPTLAKVAAVVLAASFGEITLVVGVLNHSTRDGVIVAASVTAIEAVVAYIAALMISRDPVLSARVQRLLVDSPFGGVPVAEEDEDEGYAEDDWDANGEFYDYDDEDVDEAPECSLRD
jgi:hypothetical protein